MSICAAVSAYWNERMLSYSVWPMPPAPTMPSVGAEVGLQAVEHERAPKRDDLRNDAEDDLGEPPGAGGADALHRARIDRLDRLGIEFREHAGVVDEQRHHAGERPEPDCHHEQQC